MQGTITGGRLITYGIGVGCGLVAGLIGVAQWGMAQRNLAAGLAWFHAVQQQDLSFFDADNVAKDYQWSWFTTTPIGAIAVLIICMLAAFTVCWSLHSRREGMVIAWLAAAESRRDGVVAAWVAAIVEGGIWALATYVAIATSPDPDLTAELANCESVLGLLVFGALIPLAPRAAWMGLRARSIFARRHHVH